MPTLNPAFAKPRPTMARDSYVSASIAVERGDEARAGANMYHIQHIRPRGIGIGSAP